jgi:hypothetical protein
MDVSKTSIPLVVIGVGGSVAYFFKGIPRTLGIATMVFGFTLFFLKRS